MDASNKFSLVTIFVGLLLIGLGWFLHTFLVILGVIAILVGLFMFFGGYILP